MLLGCIQAFGQESRKEVCIGFPVGNSTLDTAYGNNAARLSEVVSFLESVKKDSTLELVEVSFCGSASPEGGFAINRELAEKRRNSLERYVRERVSLPDGIISRPEGFIAWERLAELVEVSDMPHKEEAVDVKVGQDKTSGKYVTLRHGNYTVSYCHLSKVLVGKGATVRPRDVVGVSGSTGRSTGEHLHITCKLNGKSIDPLLVLDYIKSIQEECVAALATL